MYHKSIPILFYNNILFTLNNRNIKQNIVTFLIDNFKPFITIDNSINTHKVFTTYYNQNYTYLLFFTKINNVKHIFFIKKLKLEYYIVCQNIFNVNIHKILLNTINDSLLFNNTLIGGELIIKNNKIDFFAIEDIYMYNNEILNNMKLQQRIQLIIHILQKSFNHIEDICLFKMKIKQFFKLKNEIKNVLNIQHLFKTLNNNEINCILLKSELTFHKTIYNNSRYDHNHEQ